MEKSKEILFLEDSEREMHGTHGLMPIDSPGILSPFTEAGGDDIIAKDNLVISYRISPADSWKGFGQPSRPVAPPDRGGRMEQIVGDIFGKASSSNPSAAAK
ncbi:unnamed protein product [Dovyalis caffra]|uniref:Uncharacterized protein n=1 Tax=Dovyalis caffra TaxID=77055 RepID=A0AAV1S7M6_9ROSI|nr:unnamed protein product [Dovyalis caffra]